MIDELISGIYKAKILNICWFKCEFFLYLSHLHHYGSIFLIFVFSVQKVQKRVMFKDFQLIGLIHYPDNITIRKLVYIFIYSWIYSINMLLSVIVPALITWPSRYLSILIQRVFLCNCSVPSFTLWSLPCYCCQMTFAVNKN